MKKKIVTLSIVLVFVIALLITAIFLFRVKSVDIANASEFVIIDDSQLELINKKVSDYEGKNILFLKSSELKNDIEKVVPYARVENVAREFPNVIVVSISERVELFALPGTWNGRDGYYILDRDLKVLKHQTGYVDSYVNNGVNNLILINGVDFNENDSNDSDDVTRLVIGEKLVLKNSDKQTFIESISNSFFGLGFILFSKESEVQKFIHSVDLSASNSTNGIIYLKNGSTEGEGCKIYFNTYATKIQNQVQALMSAYNADKGIFNQWLSEGKEVYIIPENDGFILHATVK